MRRQKLFLIFLLSVCYSLGRAQTDSTRFNNSVVYTDKAPEFPNGIDGLIEFVEKEMFYPKQARKEGICGRVLTSFVVDSTGQISNVQVLEGGVNEFLDAEAVRIISSMPKWIPGTINGKAVTARTILPVTFYFKDCRPVKSKFELDLVKLSAESKELITKGLELRQAGNYREAEEVFTTAIQKMATPEGLVNRAIVKSAQNNTKGYCADLFVAAALGDADAKRLFAGNCNLYKPEELLTDSFCTLSTLNRMADFRGGRMALDAFSRSKIIYPEFASQHGIQGDVKLKLDVGMDGKISNIRLRSSPDNSLTKEALRVAELLPEISPLFIDGCPVVTKDAILPIRFSLNRY